MSVDTITKEAPVVGFVWTESESCDRGTFHKRSDGRGLSVSEQAYHRWTKTKKGKESELFLCNHHNKQHAEALISSGWALNSHPRHDSLHLPLDVNG